MFDFKGQESIHILSNVYDEVRERKRKRKGESRRLNCLYSCGNLSSFV